MPNWWHEGYALMEATGTVAATEKFMHGPCPPPEALAGFPNPTPTVHQIPGSGGWTYYYSVVVLKKMPNYEILSMKCVNSPGGRILKIKMAKIPKAGIQVRLREWSSTDHNKAELEDKVYHFKNDYPGINLAIQNKTTLVSVGFRSQYGNGAHDGWVFHTMEVED